MNEIEIMELPNGIEGLISELKPAKVITWNSELRKYEVDNSNEAIAKQQAGCELVKTALRDIYSFGETIARGTPKFCLALHRIFNNLKYIEDENNIGYSYHEELNVKPSMGFYGREGENFTKLVGQLGLSSSAAYRYKDLGNFVDEQTGEFYTEFKGYSLSLLSEIWTYAVESYNRTAQKLKALSKLIPADTTIVDIRAYRKIMKLKDKFKAPFDDFENRNKIDANKTKLPKVLKIYNELIQTAEAEKQKQELNSMQTEPGEVEYAGQLPGQTAMELPERTEPEDNNFFERLENTVQQHDIEEPAPALMRDDELIDYCITYTGGNSFWKERKFRIQNFALNDPLQNEFLNFVKKEYGNGDASVHSEPFTKIEFSDNFIITRATGGKVCVHWARVAGNISRLIGAHHYLSLKEKYEFERWKAEQDGVAVASEPSEELEESDEKLEVYENVTVRIETPDDELAEYCLTADCHAAALGIKFEIYDRYFLMEPNPFFQEFLINTYSNFSVPDKWGEGGHFDRLESDKQRGLIIYRIGGGALLLDWTTVTGKIMNLIKADKYLTSEERKQFDDERARKTANEKAQRQQTNREYLATLPDEELINKLLVKILNVYPFRGESSKFLSTLRAPLKEWLNTPHEVTE